MVDSVEIWFNINPVNDAPVIIDKVLLQNDPRWIQIIDSTQFTIDFTGNESDVEDFGVNLDWYIEDLDPTLMTYSGGYSDNDVFTFTAIENIYGIDSFTLYLVDSGLLVDSVVITFTIINTQTGVDVNVGAALTELTKNNINAIIILKIPSFFMFITP